MIMRIYYQQLGGHTHVKIFTGRSGRVTLGKAGDLCMTNEEFEAWRIGSIVSEFVESKNTVSDEHTTAVSR